MKSLKYIITIFTLLSMISCNNEIVNTDNNPKNILKYSKILSNQENNVVLPLANGNKWFYLTTFFKSNSNQIDFQRIDSIEVNQLEYINHETWHNISWFNRNYLASNTDIGLYFKIPNQSNQEDFLEANYPNYTYTYYAGKHYQIITDSVSGYSLVDSSLLKVNYETINSFEVSKVNYNCIKYTTMYESLSGNISDLKSIHYYVPNLGLIKRESLSGTHLNYTSDYIGKSVNYPIMLNIKGKYLDLGKCKFGDSIKVNLTKVLENKMYANAIIYGTSINIQNCIPSVNLSTMTINPNSSLDLTGFIIPKSKDYFAVYYSISTNRGIYEFALLGKAE